MNKKLRTLLLIGVLALAALALSGCISPQAEVDLDNPPGWWQAFVVYPLAKLLMILNDALASLGIPYSYGWAIIIFTLAVKVLTLPLTLKQLRSTKAQQQLQPQLRELQQKYGKDRQRLSEEQMKLYRESGINPLGGCLPLLIQLPVLWGLYQALYVLANPSVGELQNAGFFWIPDLSFPGLTVGTRWIAESFNARDWGMLAAYMSLPLIMLITQLLLQKMAQPSRAKGVEQDAQSRMMGQMMFFMPLMFAWITLGVPAGLTLYWSVSNLLSLVQQYFVTGWGGLADWLGFLRRSEPAPAIAAASQVVEPAQPEKPVKRRRRRR